MREIKFRAWLSTKNKMKSWDDICLDEFHGEISICSLMVGDYANLKVMQYTGLKDKNDKEIYEGDIVRVVRQSWTKDFEILWNNDRSGFMVWQGNQPNISFDLTCDTIILFNIEIIGNIWDNPEL